MAKKNTVLSVLKSIWNSIINLFKQIFLFLGKVIDWIFKFLEKIIIFLGKVVDHLGKFILWVWALSLVSVLVMALTVWILSLSFKNVDHTNFSYQILEKFEPLLKLETQRLEKEKRDAILHEIREKESKS